MAGMLSPREVFNHYAERYESEHGSIKRYQAMLDRLVAQVAKRKNSLLDLGCGPGNLSMYLNSKIDKLDITCVDISEKMLEIAQRNLPGSRCLLLDVTELGVLEEGFGIITLGFCLPYLPMDKARLVLNHSSRLASPEACLYLSTIEGAYHDSGVRRSSDGKHTTIQYYYNNEQLNAMLHDAGFEVLESVTLTNDSDKEIVMIAKRRQFH